LAREITCLPPVGPGGRRFKAKLKADADIEIERLKSSLQIEAAEHQVRFAKLHKKRGEIIAELYALLVEAHSVADEGVLGDADKTREAFDKILKLSQFIDLNRIYLPPAVCALLDNFTRTLRSSKTKLHVYFSVPRPTEKHAEAYSKFLQEALTGFQSDLPAIREQLEKEFRAMLGVES